MMEKKVEEKIVEFKLETVEEKDGKFFFTATSLSKDFECEKGLKIIANKNDNKDLIWRHDHPIKNKENHIYGKVDDSWYEDDGFIHSRYEVYGHTQDHLDLRDLIRERADIQEPLGISMRYRKYFDDSGNIIHYDVFEHSSTPYPKCKECKTIEYIGEAKLPDKPKKEEPKKEEVKELDEKELEEQKTKINELEKNLDSKMEKLNEFKSKIETLEAELIGKTQETLTLEERVEKLEKGREDLKLEVDYFKKKPTLDEMFEINKTLDKEERAFYVTKELGYLKDKLTEWKDKATKEIVTETLEESAKKSKEEMDKEMEDEKLEDQPFEKFASGLDPRIVNAYKKLIKGEE